jgi:long-chain acyl-CoA synthetase
MVSHRNIIANTESIIQYLQLSEADRIMTVLPFHYCFGTSLLCTHLRAGGSLVLESRFMYPETVLQRMLETECTGFAGVPSHYQILLRASSLRKKNFPYLRYVQQAGGALPAVFIRELKQALPHTEIFIMYGQPEATARLSYLPPEYLDRKLGSVGKGIPGVKLRVLDESGGCVRPGQVGEIVAEGESIALGYWREPAETAVRFRNGVLHTGELATVDEDGFIYIVDRAQDFLKCGGTRISCRQIEDQLLECEEVLEAAVVGIPDEVLGEAVKAFVVPRTPKGNSLLETLHSFCRRTMPLNVVPKDIVILQALPKNSAGKVLKNNLRIAQS